MTSPNTPTITWRDGQPYANAFEDVYFSSENGLAETEFVFLANNQLAERFKALDKKVFSIAETGFGTGLNFLSTWQLWEELAPPSSQLHFTSIEKYPLSLDEMRLALAHWPSLASVSTALLAHYPALTPGLHQIQLAAGRVILKLWIGDIKDVLPQLNTPVDAWFLDGFAPAKNPDMWSETVFEHMAKLAHAETTFATFTSAGNVRRGLHAAGFDVEKRPGFGKKREMLRGSYRVGNK